MFAVGTNLASVTAFAVVLLVLGTALELLALGFARRDLRDAHAEEEARQAALPTTMAAGKHTVSAWITDATRTRTAGDGCSWADSCCNSPGTSPRWRRCPEHARL